MTIVKQPRQRSRRAVAVLTMALIAVPLVGSAQQADDFFESNFDGGWVGTLEIGQTLALMQLNVNAHTNDGVVFVMLPDNLGGAPSEVQVFAANVSKANANKLTFTIDTASPLRATTTFKLSYKKATDTVTGKSTGSTKGKVNLVRMDPAVPLQKLWSGSVTMNGSKEFVLFMFTEAPVTTSRFADSTVGGEAWVGDEQGSITGTLTGKKLEATVGLASGDYVVSASLKKKDTKLNGTATQNGSRASLKLTSPVGTGKALKFRSAAPTTVNAGETTSVALNGANFAAGTNVHSDDPGVEITSVQRTSAKRLDVTVTPAAEVADGTAVALRVVGGDGQVAQKNNALTVAGNGGDDGDGGDGGDDGDTNVSFANEVQPIFTANCALSGCHNAASASGGMVLEAGSAFANIVGVASSEQPSLQRINAGNAEMSYLVRKIRGDSGISGGRMPLNRPPLSAAQIQTIVDWANQGAANNSPAR